MVHPCEQSYEVYPALQKPEIVCDLVGSKQSVTIFVRYWFGPGDITYIEPIDSDGNSHGLKNEDGSEAHPMDDFFRGII